MGSAMSMWSLHSGTLGLSTVVLTASSAVMAFIMGRSNPVGAKVAQSWGWTMSAASVAFLFWFLGQDLGPWASFVVGNSAAVVYSMLFIRSMRMLVGNPIRNEWLVAQFVVGMGGIALVQLANAPRGVAVVAIAASFLFAGAGAMHAIAKHPPTRSTHWGKTLIAVLGVWCALVVGLRLYALAFGGGADAVRPLATTNTQVLALFAGTLMIIIVSLGFLAILAEQQRVAALESSRRDGLTGVLTRAAFFERALSEIAGTHSYSIAMLDLDHFKGVNDRYGHLGGDAVLRHAAVQLMRSVRAADIVGRYGGEEFCVMLPGCDESEALKVASRICQESARQSVRLADGRSVSYTVSVGVANASVQGGEQPLPSVESTIERADMALYRAKAMGRNQVQVCEAGVETLPSNMESNSSTHLVVSMG